MRDQYHEQPISSSFWIGRIFDVPNLDSGHQSIRFMTRRLARYCYV
ncbi:hypothetical protein [Hoeflea sp.]